MSQPRSEPQGHVLRLSERVSFEFGSRLSVPAALSFVRDPHASLAAAPFIGGIGIAPATASPSGSALSLVSAELLVDAPLFGRRSFPFVSELQPTATGARLAPLSPQAWPEVAASAAPMAELGGWAEVAGSVGVAAAGGSGQASTVSYSFEADVYLDLPPAQKWGGKALGKMVQFAAESVLRDLLQSLRLTLMEAADSAAESARLERSD